MQENVELPPGGSAPTTARVGRARAIRPGDTLGRYEIGDELGEGGMATVFKARDTQLRRDVAVKVLFPHLAKRDEIVRRFQREARAAAGLEHPNILRIYDVGGAEGDDPPYIVMEIIRGRSLLEEIEQRGPMFPEVAACIGALLADALAAAHAASIVHRDIKPANVMIAPGGRLLLTDFGVARLETEDSLVTKTGALLGTPAYMSPEQASGDTATAKSDLYSLGATLYQLATGGLPYTGSPAKVLAQIVSGAFVAPAKKRPGVGPDLSRIVEKLMRVEPAQRTESAAAVAAELRALAISSGFGEPAEELAAYFADPAAFVAQKTPKVLATTLAAADVALTDGKLPRAMALADRANVIAPDDPAVVALIEKVSAGGPSRDRRRLLGYVAIGVLVASGATFGALKLAGVIGDDRPVAGIDGAVAMTGDGSNDADVVAMTGDGGIGGVDGNEGGVGSGTDVRVIDAGITREDAGTRARDAAMTREIDAGVRARPDGSMATMPDAAIVPPIDAVVIAPPIDAAPAKATLVVTNNVWCDVFVDGAKRGQFQPGRPLRIDVDVGSREVTCSQSTTAGNSWTKTIAAKPGEQAGKGAFDMTVEIKLEVATTVEGTLYPAGSIVKVKRGSVKIGDKYVPIAGPCTVRKDLACYR
ncbi:MAG: protein kinase domain-containing protein [Kofleriaceae bacterium]